MSNKYFRLRYHNSYFWERMRELFCVLKEKGFMLINVSYLVKLYNGAQKIDLLYCIKIIMMI